MRRSGRAWRPNATRTPREYLRLLRPGCAAERALRDLTLTLERTWYGDAAAEQGQFLSARASFAALGAARLERWPVGEAPHASPLPDGSTPVGVAGGAG